MKIINIASSDNFEDILEAVKESKSDSLILIVPKSNPVFKNKSKLEKLKVHFNKLKKEVSIIPSGQKITEAALKGNDPKKDKDLFSFYSEFSRKAPPRPVQRGYPGRLAFRPLAGSIKLMQRDSKKFFLILLGSAIFLFAFIALASLSEVSIKIIPRKSDFSVNIPVAVLTDITKNDEVYGMVPGQWIEIEKVVSKTFASSAEKDVFQKARGRAVIYNNFSASPQILVATTRFQTAEGLVFRILKTITVPGQTKEGDKSKTGEIEVEIIADRAGEEYNIEPSDFRIPGFLGSSKYQGFYAKSFEKFSGGFIGRSSFVSKDDLEKAEEIVREEGIGQVKAEMNLAGDFKILDEALIIETEKSGDSSIAGDLVKEFKVDFKIKARTVAFKERNIIDFISQYVKNSQNLSVVKDSLKINYDQPELNQEKRELSFKLVSSGQTVQNISKEKIISDIAGKKISEADFYFGSLNEIESARISSPFWMRKIPSSARRINIESVIE
ncbi:MAG: hypothetical protein HY451_00265 [Parcubacteria group bacterium]|nr:hypothetical protein [Parcubacteria group bacterium]